MSEANQCKLPYYHMAQTECDRLPTLCGWISPICDECCLCYGHEWSIQTVEVADINGDANLESNYISITCIHCEQPLPLTYDELLESEVNISELHE